MTRESDKNIFSHFIKYQAIYALIAYLVITWTIYGQEIELLKENDIKQAVLIEKNDVSSQEIKTRLASIETSLEFIKQRLQ